jgi:N-acetyl-gamma-glutamyl-phosphate reductase
MNRPRVGVVGASGYSGVLASRLLARHPSFQLAFCTSDARKGTLVRAHGIDADLTFVANDQALAASAEVDAVLLATPAEVSLRLATELRARHADLTVCDLSGAFRLDSAEAYQKHYGFAHTAEALLGQAHYGVPELFGAPRKGALIANPGCYPTATLLALAPLLQADQVEPHLVVDAKSGTTGAGRQAKEDYSFSEVADDFRAYRVHRHQHEPEIARFATKLARGGVPNVVFVPHLLPIPRGILVTAYARLRDGVDESAVTSAFAKQYQGARFVQLATADTCALHHVVGTNDARIGVSVREGSVVVIACIDNLLKGAAGQALQNVNLAFGVPEHAGLDGLQRSHAS